MSNSPGEKNIHIAAIISAHGFGHAARASAVLERLREFRPDLHYEIFSEVPEWFFSESLGRGFSYHALPTDVGVVQDSPFRENLQETYLRLKAIFSPETNGIEMLAQMLRETNCRFALCDIAPLGILAAGKAGIPSILVENFTWDWIYQGYLEREPRLAELIDPLESIFASANLHIQTEPICAPRRCDFVARPAARQTRLSRDTIRQRLGVHTDASLVLVTSGGIEQKFGAVDRLARLDGKFHFVIPGGADRLTRRGNISLLPHHSDYFHPDLVYASDAVVGKLGYSTIAEAYYAGVPFGYVPRDHFRETRPLANYVQNNLGGFEISQPDHYIDGEWVTYLPRLLEIPRQVRTLPNGALQIAEFIFKQTGLFD